MTKATIDRLTPRQRQTYDLAVEVGYTAKEIAGQLGISAGTVQAHLTRIYRVFGVSDHPALIVQYWRNRLDSERGASGVSAGSIESEHVR